MNDYEGQVLSQIKMPKTQFPKFIYDYRKYLGLTQAEFGKEYGVSHAAVSDWEAGKTEAPYRVLEDSLTKSKMANSEETEEKSFNNMRTIQTLLQEYVDESVKNTNFDKTCPPEYVVSIGKNELILTITHNGASFSEVIFPEKDMTYGISLLKDRLDSLYARTM